jgi:hypothetical protein
MIFRTEHAEQEREELWVRSVRAYNSRRRRDLLWERLRYHERLLANHTRTSARLTAHHRAEVRRYEELLGIQHEETA